MAVSLAVNLNMVRSPAVSLVGPLFPGSRGHLGSASRGFGVVGPLRGSGRHGLRTGPRHVSVLTATPVAHLLTVGPASTNRKLRLQRYTLMPWSKKAPFPFPGASGVPVFRPCSASFLPRLLKGPGFPARSSASCTCQSDNPMRKAVPISLRASLD